MKVTRKIGSFLRWVRKGRQPDSQTVLLELSLHAVQQQPMGNDGTWVPGHGQHHKSAVHMLVDCVTTGSKSHPSYDDNDKVIVKIHDTQLVSTGSDKRRLAVIGVSSKIRDRVLAVVTIVSVANLCWTLINFAR